MKGVFTSIKGFYETTKDIHLDLTPSLRCQAYFQLTHATTLSKSWKRAFQPIPPGLLICTQNKDLCKGTEKIALICIFRN